MNLKISTVFEKLWFVIIEIIIALAYAISVYFKATNAIYRNNFWVFNLVISMIMILFACIAVDYYVRNSGNRVYQIVAIMYSVIICIDTCLNDALVGMALIGILLLNLARKVENVYNSVAKLFLSVAIALEAVSLFALAELIQNDAMMLQNVKDIWVDVVFVIAFIFYIVSEKEKLTKARFTRIFVLIGAIIIEIACIIVGVYGAYLRNTSYCITAEQVKEGTTVYITNADLNGMALTCNENEIIMSKLSNSDNQVFKFEKAEEDGYWHIVADNLFVLDVSYVLFEEGNTVIAWEENGVEGQHWQVEDLGNNVVSIVSNNPMFRLTWGDYTEDDDSVTQRTLITAKQGDRNSCFFMKNAETVKTPFVGWIVNGNRFVVILAYIVIMVLITIATGVVIFKK